MERDYRSALARAAFERCLTHGDASLVLYDVTTLCFLAAEEDAAQGRLLRETPRSPQIVVGRLVDRNGFPLEVSR